MNKQIVVHFNPLTMIKEDTKITKKSNILIRERTFKIKNEEEIKDYYIHICSKYIIIMNNNWKVLYSYEIHNSEEVGEEYKYKWKVEEIHPLSIERDINYQRMSGIYDKENKVLKLSNGIEINMKNI